MSISFEYGNPPKEAQMIKLQWRVADAPTGRYRSFQKRGWPSADFKGTDRSAAHIYCDDSYVPANAKSGEHRELTVTIADYSAHNDSFKWRTLKARFKTLDEAKAAAVAALEKHPDFIPQELK
jgi:hypothetical protein